MMSYHCVCFTFKTPHHHRRRHSCILPEPRQSPSTPLPQQVSSALNALLAPHWTAAGENDGLHLCGITHYSCDKSPDLILMSIFLAACSLIHVGKVAEFN